MSTAMNKIEQISTPINKYQQVLTDINVYQEMSTTMHKYQQMPTHKQYNISTHIEQISTISNTLTKIRQTFQNIISKAMFGISKFVPGGPTRGHPASNSCLSMIIL